MFLFDILIAIIALGIAVYIAALCMVVFHELGHYLGDIWYGNTVESVEIGEGVTIFSFHIGQTRFVFNHIPISGYVESENRNDVETEKLIRILYAGPMMNLCTGLIGFVLLIHQVLTYGWLQNFVIVVFLIIFCLLSLVGVAELQYSEHGDSDGDQIRNLKGLQRLERLVKMANKHRSD